MSAYYNDSDPVAAETLRHLIREGVIAPGDVDERSITEVQADDVRGYTQAHFFAGGGLWSVAARLAGWPDDKPLWTGSCPCQPWSKIGKRLAQDDARDLWPDYHRLIRAGRPAVVVGEQVASALGRAWLDRMHADLEADNYAGRAIDLPACAVDAPQIRQRLYWAAYAREAFTEAPHVDHAQFPRLEGHAGHEASCLDRSSSPRSASAPDGVSFWSDAEWVRCADGYSRRAKPGLRMLVERSAERTDLWRIAGNSIVPQLAAEVLASLNESLEPIVNDLHQANLLAKLHPASDDPSMLGVSKYERKERDLYPTIDQNVTIGLMETLFEHRLLDRGAAQSRLVCWEPACGDGEMVKVLRRYFSTIITSDIVPLMEGAMTLDFLKGRPKQRADIVITNPPFGDGIVEFMERGVTLIRAGHTDTVCMLGRKEVDSAVTRTHLFKNCPEFVAKIDMLWRPRWEKDSTGSPRHNYSWYVWQSPRLRGAQDKPYIIYTGKHE